jgi:hypothetical protein
MGLSGIGGFYRHSPIIDNLPALGTAVAERYEKIAQGMIYPLCEEGTRALTFVLLIHIERQHCSARPI